MSFDIGTLTIQMSANIARLQTDMADAKRVVGTSMKEIQEAVDVAKRAFIGLTGVASFAAFKGMIDGAIESAAQLHKLSIQAGISVEQLSALNAVGKATGTGADTIAAASNKLSKALASQNEDSKGAAAALKALGLSFNDFQTMAPDERMKKIADALNQFQDGGQKSAAAMMLMGKSGAEMLPFLKDLAVTGPLVAKVTTDQAEAAHQYEAALGKLKTQSDAWKKSLAMELLPTLNDIVDAMLSLKKSTADTGTALGEGFKTVLQTISVLGVNVIYVFKQMGIEVGGMVAQLAALARLDFRGAGAIGDAMKDDAKKAREEVDKLSTSLLGLTNSRAGAGRGGSATSDPRSLGVGLDFKAQLTGLNGDARGTDRSTENQGLTLLNALKSKYEQLTGGVSEYYDALRKMAAMKSVVDPLVRKEIENQARINDGLVTQQKIIESFTKAEEARQTALESADAAFTDGVRAMSLASKDIDFQISLLGKNATQISMLTTVRALGLQQSMLETDITNKLTAANAGAATINERVNFTRREAIALQEKQAQLMKLEDQRRTDPGMGIDQATKDYVEKVRKMGDAWKDVSATAISGFEDNVVAMLTSGKASWKDYFNTIIAESLRLNVIRPLMSSIMGPVGSGLKNLVTGGGNLGGGNPEAAGGYGDASGGGGFLAGIGKLLGFAAGGDPPVGVPYMVGEKGPELRIDRTPATIIPNNKLGSLGGGITLSNTITVAGGISAAESSQAIMRALTENNRQWSEQLRRQGVLA